MAQPRGARRPPSGQAPVPLSLLLVAFILLGPFVFLLVHNAASPEPLAPSSGGPFHVESSSPPPPKAPAPSPTAPA